jgi:hypothetical protein
MKKNLSQRTITITQIKTTGLYEIYASRLPPHQHPLLEDLEPQLGFHVPQA